MIKYPFVQCLAVLESADFLPRALELLSGEQDMRIVFNTLEGNYALCLLANLTHLAYLQKDTSFKFVHFPVFTVRSRILMLKIFVTCLVPILVYVLLKQVQSIIKYSGWTGSKRSRIP